MISGIVRNSASHGIVCGNLYGCIQLGVYLGHNASLAGDVSQLPKPCSVVLDHEQESEISLT
jgi:hypothetical protein